MKISRSTGYALVAVGYIAQYYKQGTVLAQRISKQYNIPLEYLLKILQQLVRANLLRSKRGPRGGFSLAKSPGSITMLEIIEAVDGPVVTSMHIAEQTGGEPFSLRMEEISRNAALQAKGVFQNATLADILTG